MAAMVNCMIVDEVIAEINAVLGLDLRSEGPLSGGEQNGVYLLKTAEVGCWCSGCRLSRRRPSESSKPRPLSRTRPPEDGRSPDG